MVASALPEGQYLKIIAKTWSRDSHGLFDYEAINTRINTLMIQNKGVLVRKKNDVKHMPENSELEIDDRELAKVRIVDKFYISNEISYRMLPTEHNINDLQNKIWYVIRQEESTQSGALSTSSSTNDTYYLKLNDVIKLGRVKYAVTEVKLDNVLESIDSNSNKPIFSLISDYVKHDFNTQPDNICKICLSNHEEEGNPMVNLCKCSGTISSVHFICLKSWMSTKLTVKENEKKSVVSYNMKSFNCEICKTPYPLRFRSDNTHFDIIDCTRPEEKNYIILESLNQLKENNNYKSIQVITLENEEKVVLGRGHETDVRINDISVSRTHSMIVLSGNKIVLKDLKSKFGTLVLMQDEIQIGDKPMCVQVGRTFMEISSINQKEKNKKENYVKVDEKGNMGIFKTTKQLFQVEKIENGKNILFKNKLNNSMDVDSKMMKSN